jgi:hypothetical protein
VALIRLERAAGDKLAADADSRFLLAADASDGAFAEYDAARAAVTAEATERAAWEAAVAAGMDAATIARRWPEEPFAVRGDAPIMFGRRRDEVWRSAPGGLYQVESVRRRGDRATLTFRKWVTGGYIATNCRETRRVDRIENGRVIYREVCSGQQWMSIDHTAKPANVPWSEVTAVRRHEVVRLVLDDERRGHVVEIVAGDAKTPRELRDYRAPVVQIRDLRLRP